MFAFYEKNPLVYIDDIRDSIEAVKRYTAGLTKEDFFNSTEKQDAVYCYYGKDLRFSKHICIFENYGLHMER